MSRDDDLRFYGLYNLVEVKATGRIGLYTGGVLAAPEKGGDWMAVRFEDGTQWRYRPEELKRRLRVLVLAACRSDARRLMTARIAGSWASRSASLVSS